MTITHLKEGYLRRNGLPRSDKATVVEHWTRHGDYLTVAVIMNDPSIWLNLSCAPPTTAWRSMGLWHLTRAASSRKNAREGRSAELDAW